LSRPVSLTRFNALELNPLVWYAGLYTASAGVLKLAGMALFLWLARSLPTEEYAGWGLLYALQTAVATFGLMGIVEAIVGLLKTHQTDAERSRLFAAGNTAFLLIAAAAALGIVLVYRATLGAAGAQTQTLVWVIASGGLLAFASLQAQVMRLREDHRGSLVYSFGVPLAGLSGSFVAFVLLKTAESFFVGSTVGLALGIGAAWILGSGSYQVTSGGSEVRGILRRVGPFVGIALLGWLNGYGNNYVVRYFFQSEEVARFTFALTVSSLMQLVASAMNQVWSPHFYRIVHQQPAHEVESRNTRFFGWQAVGLGLVGGIVLASLSPVLLLLGGNLSLYRSMGPQIGLMVCSYIVLVPFWHCQNYFLAFDRGPSVLTNVVITSALGSAVWVLCMWLLGSIGIYLGFLIQMILRTAGLIVAARADWPIRINWGGLLAGAALTACGLLIGRP
jgi:O-antigen/teichoic acid export membrane protein